MEHLERHQYSRQNLLNILPPSLDGPFEDDLSVDCGASSAGSAAAGLSRSNSRHSINALDTLSLMRSSHGLEGLQSHSHSHIHGNIHPHQLSGGSGDNVTLEGRVEARTVASNFVSVILGTAARNGWSVGYLSVLMLLCVTLTNLGFDLVNAQVNRLDGSSTHYYDALSADVIMPPFHYKTSNSRPRSGLGSAAIDSVTSALSPILPFTGGVDLRRKEYWDMSSSSLSSSSLSHDDQEGWWFTASSLVGWVQTAVTGDYVFSDKPVFSSVLMRVPRAGALDDGSDEDGTMNVSSSQQRNAVVTRRRSSTQARSPVLAAPEPFLSKEEIAQMTLADMAGVFRYAIESNRDGFDESQFFDQVSPRMKQVAAAMDDATMQSRGENVRSANTQIATDEQDDNNAVSDALAPSVGFGDMDALQFCAAMRLFAEWRILRQVPEGYKGYAVGMGLGHKDVVQNVAKIESAAHAWTEEQSEDNIASSSSPTLRQLLQYEVDSDFHPTAKLPQLKEKSSAMGLLWVRRQLQYQTAIFSNMMEVPSTYPNTNAAVAAAYKEVYDQYHGWAVQKIFNYSFQAAPQAEVIMRFMNPHRLKEVLVEATLVPIDESINEERILGSDASSEIVIESIDDENITPVQELTIEGETLEEQCKEKDGILELAANLTKLANGELFLKDEQNLLVELNSQESMNPFLRFGIHVVNEWDKLGNEMDKLGKHIGGEWDKLSIHVGNEWEKVADTVANVMLHKNRPEKMDLSSTPRDVSGGGGRRGLTGDALEEYVTQQMLLDAEQHISLYLGVARPLLRDLAGLFHEMNMDDPTKV